MNLSNEEFDIIQKEFQKKDYKSFTNMILTASSFAKLKNSKGFTHFLKNYIQKNNTNDVFEYIIYLRKEDNRLTNQLTNFKETLLLIEVNAYTETQEYKKCEEKVKEIKKISTDSLILSDCLLALADAYFVNNKYTEAYYKYLEVLKLLKHPKNEEELSMKGICLLNLSVLFQFIGEFDKMLNYMSKADLLFEKHKKSTYYSDFLLTKAAIYYEKKKINASEALEIINQVECLLGNGIKSKGVNIKLYKLKYLLDKKDTKRAKEILNYLNENILNYSNFTQHQIIVFNSNYLYLIGENEEFIAYIEQHIEEIASTTTILEKDTNILHQYIELQEKLKNYKKASKYYKILFQKQFNANRADGILKINKADARNDIKKKDQEIEIQRIYSKKIEALNEKLLNKNKELEYFAGMAAHDIRSPVRTINSIVNIIRNDASLSEDLVELMKTVEMSSKRIYNLVDDLLSYSRSGKFPEVHDTTCFDKVLSIVTENISCLIEENKAKINITTPLPEMKLHESALVVLFQNIIINAIKFKKENTPPIINISGKREDKFCSIYIQDNGIGMSKQNSLKIFEPFTKLSTSKKTEGSGLGLATCAKIIENYNGKISVESEINVGTTFKVSFLR